jgi:hypothetical protein
MALQICFFNRALRGCFSKINYWNTDCECVFSTGGKPLATSTDLKSSKRNNVLPLQNLNLIILVIQYCKKKRTEICFTFLLNYLMSSASPRRMRYSLLATQNISRFEWE